MASTRGAAGAADKLLTPAASASAAAAGTRTPPSAPASYAAVGTTAPTAVADGIPPLPPLVVPRPSLTTRLLLGLLRLTDATLPWHRLPSVVGVALLAARRVVLQRLALLPVGGEPAPPPPPAGTPPPPPPPPDAVPYRTDDGSGNDPAAPFAGAHGVYFGRNCPPVPVGERDVHRPPPQLVAERLLTRRPSGPARVAYKHAGDQMSVVGAAWIQFMVHSWLRHIPEDRSTAGDRQPSLVTAMTA